MGVALACHTATCNIPVSWEVHGYDIMKITANYFENAYVLIMMKIYFSVLAMDPAYLNVEQIMQVIFYSLIAMNVCISESVCYLVTAG